MPRSTGAALIIPKVKGVPFVPHGVEGVNYDDRSCCSPRLTLEGSKSSWT